MNQSTIGTRIRQARKRLGYTQDQVARACNVPTSYPCLWEKGRMPNPQHIISLARVLGVSTDYLLKGEEEATHAAHPPAA